MTITEADIQTRLRALVDPNTGKDFVTGKAIKKIRVDGANIDVDVQLAYPAKTQHEVLRKLIAEAVAAIPGAGRVGVNMAAEKNLPWGRQLRTPLGIGLLAWAGAVVLAHV